jgi:hypothetical protein
MRVLLGLVLPLLLQVVAYIVVFAAARGGGSFMGLLAMPVAAGSLAALLIVGIKNVRSSRPLTSVMLVSLLIVVVPPILLLLFRALER